MIEGHYESVKGWKWKYFTPKEMACKCCGYVKVDEGFMNKLEALRMNCKFPFPVNSAYRCVKHNQAVSSTGDSGPHTTGRAVDIGVDRGKAFKLLGIAIEMGFTGIGLAQKGESRYIHLDDLTDGLRPTVWSY